MLSLTTPALGQIDPESDEDGIPCNLIDVLGYEGLYTDKASYKAGDTLQVFGNWPNESVKYRIVRIEDRDPDQFTFIDWANTTPVPYGAAEDEPPFGSFVEFSEVSLYKPPETPPYDREFTIEGWVRPTYVWDDGVLSASEEDPIGAVIVAGQVEYVGGQFRGVGIGIRHDGKPFGIASIQEIDNPSEKIDLIVEQGGSQPTLLEAGKWYYLALTMRTWPMDSDDTEIELYLGNQQSFAWRLEKYTKTDVRYELQDISSLKFRLGARNEAPGADTGCLSGRIDKWGVWDDEGLRLQELKTRQFDGIPTSSGMTPNDPPDNPPVIDVDFEDPYGAAVSNDAPAGSDGLIIGHGTPGVSGVGKTTDERGLRLNHDQVIDAEFDEQTVSKAIPPAGTGEWESGLYAVQAVFDRNNFDPTHPDNVKANHYSCFVLRNDLSQQQKAGIAVLVPVNTWMAYNAWPGDYGAYEGNEGGTAAGLTMRKNPLDASRCYAQGNNSAYSAMGDGASPGHYMGWRRPNLMASPVLDTDFFNWPHAPMDVHLFEWLEDPPGGLIDDLEYDVYSDWDLHSVLTDDHLDDYAVLMLVGHLEYWSETMLDRLHTYLDRGGNVISIGGNAIGYRSELTNTMEGNDVTGVTGVLEVKKWPAELLYLAPWDSYSLMADTGSVPRQKTGGWRFIETIKTSDPKRDFILGTLGDMVGFTDKDEMGPVKRGATDQYGRWAGGSPHAFWGSQPPAPDAPIGSFGGGRVIGHESDRYFDNTDSQFANAPAFSFGDTSTPKPQVLAYGFEMDPNPPADDLIVKVELQWDDFPWAENETQLNFRALNNSSTNNTFSNITIEVDVNEDVLPPVNAPYAPAGQIVYYKHWIGGAVGANTGRVLTLGSISAPLGLLDPYSVAISQLVERALDCMVQGNGCP